MTSVISDEARTPGLVAGEGGGGAVTRPPVASFSGSCISFSFSVDAAAVL